MKKLVYVAAMGCFVSATIPMVVAVAQKAPSAEDADFVCQAPEGANVITRPPGSDRRTTGQFRAALDGILVYPAQGGRRPTLRIVEPTDGARVGERFTLRVKGPPRTDITYSLRWPIPAGMVGGMSAPMRARLGADGTYTGSLRMDGRTQLTISCGLTGGPGPADEVTVYSRKTPPGSMLRITEPDDGALVDGRFTVRVEGPPHGEFGWSTMHSRRGGPALAGDGWGVRIGADGKWSTVLDIGNWDTLEFSCAMRAPSGEAVSDQITVHRRMPSPPGEPTILEPENGPRPGQVPPAVGPPVLDLNHRIAEAQRDLWALKQQRAGSQAIAAKRDEVLQCRYELARLLTDSPVGANVAVTPGGRAPPSRRRAAGPAPRGTMVGLPPRPPVYRLGAGYRPSAPPASAAPCRRRSPCPAPPPPMVGLQYGPRVYRIEVGYVPTSAVTRPHRRPHVRAVPRRVEQSQQQSQGCGQQQQQQQGGGGQQQQQQMGRSQQQQQQ